MKKIFFSRWWIVSAAFVGVSACAPVYQTQYAYHPIPGRTGQMCSNTCEVWKAQCRQNVEQITRQCNENATMQRRLCEASKVYGYNKKGEWECLTNCYCYTESCDAPDYPRCEETYKECYLNCGGVVTATTACVRNCEKAEAPRIERLKKTEDGVVVDMNHPAYQESVAVKTTAKKSVKSAAKGVPSPTSKDAEREMERINAELRAKTAPPSGTGE